MVNKNLELIEKKYFLSWKELDFLCRKLAKKIKKSGFKPDLIVTIARGGLVPATIVSHSLGVQELYAFKTQHYLEDSFSKGMEINPEPKILQELNVDILGKKVLVVDDLTDSGGTLSIVKAYLTKKGPKKLRFAVVCHKPWSEFEPDYYAKITKKWIVHPWDKNALKKEGSKNGKK